MEEEELFDEHFSSFEEFDVDYEFEAPKSYDFLRPEADFERQEAELWFETAGNYSPSPHIIKLDGRQYASSESPNCYSAHNADDNVYNVGGEACTTVDYIATEVDDNNIGLKSHNHINQDGVKAKAKSPVKSPLSKISRFMNPTASQLAKLNRFLEIRCCPRLFRSPQSMPVKDENSSQGSCVTGMLASKRQKLESGYLRKVAHSKHQAILSHKAPKKAGHPDASLAISRSKVTIPREPKLETAYRAQRHGSKIIVDSVENQNPNACNFRARPLNRKVLKAPSTSSCKKSTPQMQEFQEFHPSTSKRAVQHASHNATKFYNSSPSWEDDARYSRRMDSVYGLKENFGALEKYKDRCLGKKESKLAADEKIVNELPIESFSKLSLGSKFHSKAKSQSRMPPYFKMLRTAKSERIGGNCCQYGNPRGIPSMGTQININRSLDIR